MAKIRTDFVTNSSSSSFILGFKSEETMIDELKLAFPNWGMEHFYTVMNDVENAKKLDREAVISLLREEEFWHAEWEIEKSYERKGHTYKEAIEYARTPEGQAEAERIFNKWFDGIKIQLDENTIFVEVEYSDDVNSELEHEIMPEVKNMIRRISHH